MSAPLTAPTVTASVSGLPTPTVTVTVALTTTPSPAPAQTTKSADTNPAIITAAIIAVCGVALTGLITWLLGNRSVRVAKDSAAAAKVSAAAAKEAVGVNRETASGVAARAEADAVAKRYQESAGQLGHSNAAVRLAGVHAMAKLADDWTDQRQECIDVLCAYLRIPLDQKVASESADAEVRRSIIRQIEDHVRPDANKPSWSTYRFDFRGAQITDLVLEKPLFSALVDFTGAQIIGTLHINQMQVVGTVVFDGVIVKGKLWLSRTIVERGFLRLDGVFVAKGAGICQVK